MLDFDDILQQYPLALRGFKRNLVREYLQYHILAAIAASPQASKLSFIGGTALGLVYGNNRFSEDLDFDNFSLETGEFIGLAGVIEQYLMARGFLVEIKVLHKEAFRCSIRFPGLLYSLGLTPIEEEKILIQVDTFAQGFLYTPDTKILNKFEVFTPIRVTPPDILLSQKLFTAINRKTPKGRDFYDIIFLLAFTKPNYSFLEQKLGIKTGTALRSWILEETRELDFNYLANDVQPFLFNPDDSQRVTLFREYFSTVTL